MECLERLEFECLLRGESLVFWTRLGLFRFRQLLEGGAGLFTGGDGKLEEGGTDDLWGGAAVLMGGTEDLAALGGSKRRGEV